MSYGPQKVFTGAIASGASSTEFNLSGKSFSFVYAEIGTMSTAAAMDVYAASDGTTYRPMFERVNTAPVQYQTLTVSNIVGTNGGVIPLGYGYTYLQFRASAVVSGGVAIKIIGID